MGLMVDSNVFIKMERRREPIDFSEWGSSERVYVSAVNVSELLMGIHRADTEERRQCRSEFVEAVIRRVGVLDFTVGVARVHAEVYSGLAKKGQLIGAHDLMIAATALHHGLAVLPDNVAEFSRVPGLRVIPFSD